MPRKQTDTTQDVPKEKETADTVEQITQEGDTQNDIPIADISGQEKAIDPKTGIPADDYQLGPVILDDNDLLDVDIRFDQQKVELAQMQRAIDNHTVCYGTVYAVEPRGEVTINLKKGNLKVIIPAWDVFYYSQMKDIESASDDEKSIRYARKASHMFNAILSFIPKAIGTSEKGVPFVVASRREAMDMLQNKHFFGRKADVVEGSVAAASIISASPRYVTVECLGVESIIGTGDLSAVTYIDDASETYKAGTALEVVVKKLDVDKENKTLEIAFSHALYERFTTHVEAVNEQMIGGRYLAKVAARLEKHYIVILTGHKLRGVVPKNRFLGQGELYKGDAVVLQVTDINEEKNLLIGGCLRA